jgi:putative hydrolase
MSTKLLRKPTLSNEEVAALLDEVALHLRRQAANPFRIAAYRAAAHTVRSLPQPLRDVFAREGHSGLERLPGIGKSIASKLAEILLRGRLQLLDVLRRKLDSEVDLSSLPMVGPLLADRIKTTLGAESLEEVFVAAHDGRLRRVPGMGHKRIQAIRESLAVRLDRSSWPLYGGTQQEQPPVALLLEIDRLYRQQASQDRLPRVSPRRFNPGGSAWLPILTVVRHGHRYCAMYSNTARSHQLHHHNDWVTIYRPLKAVFGVWTVITSRYGRLRGKRIVSGRVGECGEYYQRALIQRSLQLAD